MSHEDERFEEELRSDLSRMGERAGRAPSPDEVMGKLRRRSLRRRLLAGGAVAAVMAAAVIVVLSHPQRPAAGVPSAAEQNQASPERPIMARSVAFPLRISAKPEEVESALRTCLESRGLTGSLWAEKAPDEGLSYILVASIPTGPLDLKEDLEQIFQNFEIASVWLRNGDLSYSLLASAWHSAGPQVGTTWRKKR